MKGRRYVVAFAGARDGYQVPLSLHGTGQLERLVTDLYVPSLPSGVASRFARLAGRSIRGLPVWMARSSLQVLWLTHAGWRFAANADRALLRNMKSAQDTISRLAGRLALRKGSDLFLYAGYARVAFSDQKLRAARKILFMYHPHIARASEIMTEGAVGFPEAQPSLAHLEEDKKDRDVDGELQMADLVVCASEFTASTVRAIGIRSEKVIVVPYGIDRLPTAPEPRRRDRCRFLFVGTGILRKGLHLLLQAWQQAALPDAELTLVCRSLTPWLAERARVPGVVVRPGVTGEELDGLYREASVFVMPSLVEGFGYVYLEALARGCFCIGTRNTGLPDLALTPDEGQVIPAGAVDALVAALASAYHRWKRDELRPEIVVRSVERWPWSRFRSTISRYADSLPIRS
jgi:glycosyltransferase involved in cell wall biosynthesis